MDSIAQDTAAKTAARSALTLLFTLPTSDLDYLFAKGAPQGIFTALTAEALATSTTSFEEDSGSYSGQEPHIYVQEHLAEEEVAAHAARGLWLLAQELYLNPARDVADLSAWAEDGFPFTLVRSTADALMEACGSFASMPLLGQAGKYMGLQGLASLHAL